MTGKIGRMSSFAGFICAAITYLALSIYLYYPYLATFSFGRLLVMAGPITGASGVFLLSKRWVNTNTASFLAGAFYGFSPLALSFVAFHPVTQLLIASLPWLFAPAILLDSAVDRDRKLAIPAIVLIALPVISIILFYWLSAKPFAGPFFPLPVTIKLSWANLASFLIPSKGAGSYFPTGFYHIGMILLIIGTVTSLMTHRVVTIATALASLLLATSNSFMDVPPITWTLIPLLLCAILIGQAVEWIHKLLGKYKIAGLVILLCVITIVDIAICASTIIDAIL